jgi:hypothetical protein
MSAERVGEAPEIEWRTRVHRVVHRPLQLDADQPGWTMFETHRGDVRLGGRTVVQLRRDGFGRRRIP